MTTTIVAVTRDELLVAPWVDGDLDGGFAPRSPEAEHLWLPRIGPTTYLLGCRLVLATQTAALSGVAQTVVDVAALATALGVGHVLTPNSTMMRSLDRLVIFGLARVAADGWTYEIRTEWPRPRVARQRRGAA